jgi:hypothetical protein
MARQDIAGEGIAGFWIVDYSAGADRPLRFEMIKQSFAAPYQQVPSNDWGAAKRIAERLQTPGRRSLRRKPLLVLGR